AGPWHAQRAAGHGAARSPGPALGAAALVGVARGSATLSRPAGGNRRQPDHRQRPAGRSARREAGRTRSRCRLSTDAARPRAAHAAVTAAPLGGEVAESFSRAPTSQVAPIPV